MRDLKGEWYPRALHNTIPVYISQNLYGHILPTKHQNAQHFHDNIGDLCVHIRLERFFDLKFLFRMFFFLVSCCSGVRYLHIIDDMVCGDVQKCKWSM